MNCDFAPTNTKSVHVGAQRDYTTISWTEWHRRYAPNFVRCLTYKKVNDKMENLQEKSFYKTTNYIGSITEILTKENVSIIILEWKDNDIVGKANTFLNNCLPIDRNQRFQDGIVGIGLGRWLKTLFMTMIVKTESDRPVLKQWFHDLVRFTATLTTMKDNESWFDVIRTTLKTNDSVEDILPFRLFQAILKIQVPRQRMFRWFEKSMQRTLKRGQMRQNMLAPMVWLYTDRLLEKNLPDDQAMTESFQDLMKLSSYGNGDILRLLLQQIFPEIVSKTEKILDAIYKQTPWTDSVDTVFVDSSVLGGEIAEMPYGIKMIEGTISLARNSTDTFVVSTSEYNNYTPFMIRLPEAGTELELLVTGKIIPKERTSRFGSGLVCRSFKDYVKSGKDFIGVMGLSLGGGRGNGRTAPSSERTKPSYLESAPATNQDIELAIINLGAKEYSLSSREWTSPLTMAIHSEDQIFALFFKGFFDVKIQVRPRVKLTKKTIVAPQMVQGIRFSDLVDRARVVT